MSNLPFQGPEGLLLTIDDAHTSLRDLPLRLLRLGVEVVHASEIDEAELLARQEGSRLCGVMLPSESAEALLDDVVARVAPHTGVRPDQVVLLGPRLGPEARNRLRGRGVRWGLWEPHADRDLRFMGWSLLWSGSDRNLRLEHRIPTTLLGRARCGGEVREVLVGDLSLGGAFVESGSPFRAGTRIELCIELPNRRVEIASRVRWVRRKSAKHLGRIDGFGVEFLDPPKELRSLLTEYLAGELSRFAL